MDDAVHTSGPGNSRWIITCDHASNRVPDWVAGGDLGLNSSDMSRHIAYDVGAAGVAQALADDLDGCAILSRFSRLVIDPNRDEDDPTLIMQLYDGSVIPANGRLSDTDRQTRLDRLHRPYHHAVNSSISNVDTPLIVSIHSFTPQLTGRARRPWHIGLLTAQDRRLVDPMFNILARDPAVVVGDNEPYTGALKGDAMDCHGVRLGHPHVLIELRNNLIETPSDQVAWAKLLGSILTEAAAIAGLEPLP